MRLSEIWTYPVKSMIGFTTPSALLGETGIVGDRRWALRDAANGGLRTGKKVSALMQCAATTDGPDSPAARIVLPDGTVTSTDAPDINARLSAVAGFPVRLDGRPAPGSEPRRREAPPAGSDPLSEIREVMGRIGSEPLPDFSVFPADVLEFEGPLGGYYDALPLLIMTTSTMRTLSEALPGSVVDVLRFRPSLMIDTDAAPGYPEAGWARGTRLAVGSALLEIEMGCPRCVMPTREVNASIPADREILRYIVRELDQNLGVYARVLRGGTVGVGDAVVVA